MNAYNYSTDISTLPESLQTLLAEEAAVKAAHRRQKIILIGCGKSKLDHAAPAEELYTGQLFKASLKWAKAQADVDHIFILSAKHCLLSLDEIVDPYDECLNTKKPHEMVSWAREVHTKLFCATGNRTDDFDLTFLAGKLYREELTRIMKPLTTITIPLEGLGIGEQLGWLKRENSLPLGIPENSGVVVCYGAGVDSTAMLLAMHDAGVRPDLITFADTGAEKPETYEQVKKMNVWLESKGWPLVTECRKKTLASTPYEDLTGNNLHNDTLPSLAFGMKSCSIKWKQGPQDIILKGAKRGPMKRAPHWLWKNAQLHGVKLVKLIGYDSSKADIRRSSKVKRKMLISFKKEDADFLYSYPLQDLGWTREDCIKRIIEEGLEVPIKSACFFCPASQKWELWWLAGTHKDLFMKALEMEHRAMTGRHSRWGSDECTYGSDWEDLCKQPGSFPSTDVTVGLGRSFAWNHWARQEGIVDAFGNFIADQARCLRKADELKAAGGNAADRRACA